MNNKNKNIQIVVVDNRPRKRRTTPKPKQPSTIQPPTFFVENKVYDTSKPSQVSDMLNLFNMLNKEREQQKEDFLRGTELKFFTPPVMEQEQQTEEPQMLQTQAEPAPGDYENMYKEDESNKKSIYDQEETEDINQVLKLPLNLDSQVVDYEFKETQEEPEKIHQRLPEAQEIPETQEKPQTLEEEATQRKTEFLFNEQRNKIFTGKKENTSFEEYIKDKLKKPNKKQIYISKIRLPGTKKKNLIIPLEPLKDKTEEKKIYEIKKYIIENINNF